MNRIESSVAVVDRAAALTPQTDYLARTVRDLLGRRNLATNDVAAGVVVIVVAVAAFLALAAVIGALAAYIWYCQQRGMWPTADIPWRDGGVFRLYCS